MTPDDDQDAFAEQLFAAARREQPTQQVKARVVREVSQAKRRGLPSMRWLLLAAALGAGLLLLLRLRVEEPGPQTVKAETFPAPEKSLDAPARRAPEAPSAPASSMLASPTTPAPAKSATPRVRPATLQEELALVDQARQALLDGNVQSARSGLAQYDKVATNHQLAAEATLLRMQILAAEGRAAEASQLAREFAAQNPNNPLVDRAKSFIRERDSQPKQEAEP
jgi:hypothetical protein